jgi:hypothetical protein
LLPLADFAIKKKEDVASLTPPQKNAPMCWSCDRIAPICAHIAQKDWEGYCESSVFDEEFSIAAIKK